jgi:hypothetical protein
MPKHHAIKVYKVSWMLNSMHTRPVPQIEESGSLYVLDILYSWELMQRIVLGQLRASSTQLYEVSSTPSQPALCITYSCIYQQKSVTQV